jgi:hypothetical protein
LGWLKNFSFATSTFASTPSIGDFATLLVLFDAKMSQAILNYFLFQEHGTSQSTQC